MTSIKRRRQSTLDRLEAEYKDNAGMLQVVNYLKHAGRNRRPMTMVPRTAAISSRGAGGSTNYPTINPPYNNASLNRFEDCFRSDKLVQNGIVKRTELVLGKHGRIVLDTTEEFDSEDDRTKAIERVNNNTAYQDARKQIQKLMITPAIDFHNNLKAAVIQSKVYGRAAIELVGAAGADQELPTGLHVLNSKKLAQVEVDPITWRFLGVHYSDLPKGPTGMDDVIPAEQLIYFANRDYHVSPGSLYYGLSELEGVIDGSDSKRIAKQEDIKEIMKSNWAPFIILKFINPNISVTQMQEVINGMAPGLPFATKQDIESEVVSLEGDLKKLTDAIDFLNRESLRELGVPGFLGGYEQIANYANSQQVLLSYREIELEADRTWVKDIIQPQWLNKLFYQLLGIEDYEENIPEVKLTYEFEDITFETTLDNINSSLLLYDRQLISGEKVLKVAGYEDEIEEYKLRKEEIDRQKALAQQQFLNQQKQNGDEEQQDEEDDKENVPQPEQKDVRRQVSTTNKKRQASLYRKFEETLDAIRDG